MGWMSDVCQGGTGQGWGSGTQLVFLEWQAKMWRDVELMKAQAGLDRTCPCGQTGPPRGLADPSQWWGQHLGPG